VSSNFENVNEFMEVAEEAMVDIIIVIGEAMLEYKVSYSQISYWLEVVVVIALDLSIIYYVPNFTPIFYLSISHSTLLK
jgi:hypothetical protein